MKNKILVLGADNDRYALLRSQLSELNYEDDQILRCFSIQELLIIQSANFSIILACFSNPAEILLQLLAIKARFIQLPVIVLSEEDDRKVTLDAIRNGAQDFLVAGKTNAEQLGRAISFAIERKARTTKMIEIAAEYEKQFDNGPIPMWIVDSKTMKIHMVNKVSVEKYGYSKEEFAAMTLPDLRPKEDVDEFITRFTNKTLDYHDAGYARHQKKNGEIFYVHVYSHQTVFNGNEARLSFLVDVNDKLLADKKNAELAGLVKEQKEELDNILYSISDAIWSRRADTMELCYANNAYYKLYGCTSEDAPLIDDALRIEMIHPDDRDDFLEAITEVKTKGKAELVYRYVDKRGRIKILRANAVLKKGANGKPDTINGVSTDITREKELYDTIRNSEQKLRATIDNTNDLIWSVDSDLKIIFCNKAFQDFFYSLAGVLLDEGDYVLGSWRSASFVNKRRGDYQRAFEGESFSTVVEECHNGNTLYFEIRSNPIIDVRGKIVGVNCTSRDITEQRNQLLKIQQQNEKLKEIAEIQSHKVRGPVASILGLIPLFDYEGAGSEHNLEVLIKLASAANDLDKIIKDIVFGINILENK